MNNKKKLLTKRLLVTSYQVLIILANILPFLYSKRYDRDYMGYVLTGVIMVTACSLIYTASGLFKKRHVLYKLAFGFSILGFLKSFIEIITFDIHTVLRPGLGLISYIGAFIMLIVSFSYDDTPHRKGETKMIEIPLDIEDKFFLGYKQVQGKLYKLVGTINAEAQELRIGYYKDKMIKNKYKFDDIKSIETSKLEKINFNTLDKKEGFANPSLINFLIHEFSTFIASDSLAEFIENFYNDANAEIHKVIFHADSFDIEIYTSSKYLLEIEENFEKTSTNT